MTQVKAFVLHRICNPAVTAIKYLLVCLLSLPAIVARAQGDIDGSPYRSFFPRGECDSVAFGYALRGYNILRNDGLLANERYLSIIDYTKPSNVPRFFVLGMPAQRLVLASITAHGKGSDPDSTAIPQRFGNREDSRMSSVGFYITGAVYTNHRPDDSVGLCLFGLDKDYNDEAAAREIVLHYGATEYSGNVYVTDSGAGRSSGCPALPLSKNTRIINLIKGGSCLFIYSDKAAGYARNSTVLQQRLPAVIRQQGPPPNNCSCNLRRTRQH